MMNAKTFLSLVLIATGIWLTNSTIAQDTPDRQSQRDKALSEQISAILRDCEKIKPGMTRAQLLKVFTTEGGISSARHRRFVYRRCPYIKLDVEFKLSAPDQDVLDERMTDTISKISKPFLEWSIAD
jgi:hypothetical protein